MSTRVGVVKQCEHLEIKKGPKCADRAPNTERERERDQVLKMNTLPRV